MKDYYKILRKPILFVGILIFAAGIFAFIRMPTNLFPAVQFPRISIIIDAGQIPINRMMITVTQPIESAAKKVKGVRLVKSSTSRGSATVEVYFDWGLDIYALKPQLESRINEIKNFLPPGVNISAEVMNQSLFPVYGYTLENPGKSDVDLKDIANLIVRPAFSQVSGISNVIVRGGRHKEFVIAPLPDKMTALGIVPQDIIDAFQNSNFVESAGLLPNHYRMYLTLLDTRVDNIEELSNTVIKNIDGRIIKIKDVADIKLEEQQEFVKINANGNNAVIIDLVKQAGTNLVDFAKDVESKASEIKQLLPKGYYLKPYYNQSAFVTDSVDSAMKTIYEGLVLALIVIIIFLRSWRSSLVVILTIPVTVTFSFLVLYLVGITINIMSLGAIAASVGLIIDDAIVIIEQIYKNHEENPKKDRFEIVQMSIRFLLPAMIASSLTTIVIHFPFRLMSGLAGSFFRILSDTMQLTMVVSFLVTWLLLPVFHVFIGYKKNLGPRLKTKKAHNINTLAWFYDKPAISVFLVLLLISSAYFASTKLKTGFLPELDEGSIVLDYYSPPGTNIDETDRLCKEMEKVILANPDVESYSRRTGIRMSFRSHPANEGDYSIQLKRERKETTDEVINRLRGEISAKVPVLTVEFGQRIADLLGDLINTPQPIEVKIFGDDYAKLQEIANQCHKVMDSIPGIVDIDDGLVPEGPSLVFKPKTGKLALYGISLSNFDTQLKAIIEGLPLGKSANIPSPSPDQAAMTSGLQIGDIQEGQQMRRVIMRFVDFADNDLGVLRKQPIFLPDGNSRYFEYFCDAFPISGEVIESREDLKPVIILTSRLENKDLGTAVSDLKNEFAKKISLPPSYKIEYGGAYSQQQQSFRELMMILALATLFVFMVLMFLFKRWRIAFLILFISLMGITGSLILLYIFNIPLNVSSYTGIIMIVGIVAENAIFTVYQYFRDLKTFGKDDAVKNSIKQRLRPNLMTAISAILALTPLAIGIGIGAQMQQALAIAVIGGFLIGLPLLLIVLPSFLRLMNFSDIKTH
ncbi:MAG: efflux RND transporter permease subunit [Chlorobi bacterium]|nr:efflux RND transporter permease subunit [Chlorobiota bacterium]